MMKRSSDGMKDREFFDMMVTERLKMLPYNLHDDEQGDRIIREGGSMARPHP